MRWRHFFYLLIPTLLLAYLVSPTLNPFEQTMISFHDPTQAGRVTSFVENLRNGQIPPRLAPEFSFHLGMPVFNFYAPTVYWITSIFVLLGYSSGMAVKISFLLAMFAAFFSMAYFLKQIFSSVSNEFDVMPAAIFGASVYVTSTYFATEIVIRGNLAETWFLALLPFSLGLIIHQSRSNSKIISLLTPINLAAVFTTHNVLSMFALPITFVFLWLFPKQIKNLISFCIALLLSSYFLVPAIVENSFIQANAVAKEYDYNVHFLCPWQLWSANGWQFGGSLPGCDADTMSFKIGKFQVMLGLFGLVIFIFQILLKKKIDKKVWPIVFIALFSVSGIFLTLEYSRFIWHIFSPMMSLFQFPWRFIVFGIFGIAVFAGYIFYVIRIPLLTNSCILLLLFLLFLPGRKYFIKPASPIAQYEQEFNSQEYLTNGLAYKLKEYLPQQLDYAYWSSFDPYVDPHVIPPVDGSLPLDFQGRYTFERINNFKKIVHIEHDGTAVINLHYFPFWKIFINESEVIPTEFDKLARPKINVHAGETLTVFYQQTSIEKLGNAMTFIGFILLFFTVFKTRKEPLPKIHGLLHTSNNG